MTFICHNCKNKGEIPTELKQLEQEMKKYYSCVVYCSVHKTLVVANPEIPTQCLRECENFQSQE